MARYSSTNDTKDEEKVVFEYLQAILFKMGDIFCSNERCNRDMWVVEHSKLYWCIENVIVWHVSTCD
jgi:hypothetical protein